MSQIQFEAKLYKIKEWTILHLPVDASAKLPSRGVVMVKGTLNGLPFQTVLEPDGKYGPGLLPSHWFAPGGKLLSEAHAKSGDVVRIALESTDEWLEPDVPNDLKVALSGNPKACDVWESTTPIARWDWIRSIRSTNNSATRKKRIEVACSKLESGKPRQCCFNRSMCTVPEVSKRGALLGTS